MMARSIALCVLLAGSSAALGGVEVILSPQTAGPYGPGDTVAVDVLLSQDPAGDPHLLRGVQLDFNDSDAQLAISLPVMHTTPNGRIDSASDIAFWDYSSTTVCAGDSTDCGFAHFIDDDLTGVLFPVLNVVVTIYLGDLSVDPPDFNENLSWQWLLIGDGTAKKIGELRVTLPTGAVLPASCPLDVLNAGDPDVAFGARIDFGLGDAGRTTWRASAGEITGGTLDLCASGCTVNLSGSSPNDQGSLWRLARNIVRLEFDGAITQPTAGQVKIRQLTDQPSCGSFGPDLSSNFSITVETGNILRIQDNANNLDHRTWYAITVENDGDWGNVCSFLNEYVVQVGDADANRFVTAIDVGQVNASALGLVADDSRFDIDGNGFRTAADVGFANAGQGGLPPKPCR